MSSHSSIETKVVRVLLLAITSLTLHGVASPVLAAPSIGSKLEPCTIYWESSRLAEVKRSSNDSPNLLARQLQLLRQAADLALENGPYSVTFKQEAPPSGDKHDYLSYSRYWWPNPDTADGLPYIRKDGQVNRQIRDRGDRQSIGSLCNEVQILSLAYYFFEQEAYADHAVMLIRKWFLDPETKMNPHLRFGQAVPGRAVGRGVGILDTRGFIHLLDSVALLSTSNAWNPSIDRQLIDWFSAYVAWLRTSDLGKIEGAAKNNHGSWYAAQVARLAIFVDEPALARSILADVQQARIPAQFDSQGGQPHEIARTLSLHYCCFNLEALSIVARVGEHLDVDLWGTDPAAGSLRPGIDFLMPFLRQEKEWPSTQIKAFTLSRGTAHLLRMASVRYDDPAYLQPIAKQPQRHPLYDFSTLLFNSKSNASSTTGRAPR